MTEYVLCLDFRESHTHTMKCGVVHKHPNHEIEDGNFPIDMTGEEWVKPIWLPDHWFHEVWPETTEEKAKMYQCNATIGLYIENDCPNAGRGGSPTCNSYGLLCSGRIHVSLYEVRCEENAPHPASLHGAEGVSWADGVIGSKPHEDPEPEWILRHPDYPDDHGIPVEHVDDRPEHDGIMSCGCKDSDTSKTNHRVLIGRNATIVPGTHLFKKEALND